MAEHPAVSSGVPPVAALVKRILVPAICGLARLTLERWNTRFGSDMAEHGRAEWQLEIDFAQQRHASDQVDAAGERWTLRRHNRSLGHTSRGSQREGAPPWVAREGCVVTLQSTHANVESVGKSFEAVFGYA